MIYIPDFSKVLDRGGFNISPIRMAHLDRRHVLNNINFLLYCTSCISLGFQTQQCSTKSQCQESQVFDQMLSSCVCVDLTCISTHVACIQACFSCEI